MNGNYVTINSTGNSPSAGYVGGSIVNSNAWSPNYTTICPNGTWEWDDNATTTISLSDLTTRLDKIGKDLETLKKVFSWLFADQED